LTPALRHHDVPGFEIAVHDAGDVRLVERVRHVNRGLDRLFRLERPARQALGERFAFEILEDQIVGVALMADVIQGADVRMLKGGDRPRFAIRTAP
jgi:hypothetical protein